MSSLAFSYEYHGILCPKLILATDKFTKLTDRYPTMENKKGFEISFDPLEKCINLIPRNADIGKITPENFREVLTDLVTDQIISQEEKQQYDIEYTAQYQTLARIGEDHSNYKPTEYERYDFQQPKAAKEIIFLENQRIIFLNNKAITTAIDAWLIHFKKLALLEDIHLASGFLTEHKLLAEFKTTVLNSAVKKNKFINNESSLLDWLYAGFYAESLTRDKLLPINDFLQNNTDLLPFFQIIALWTIFGTDSRLDESEIFIQRRQLQFILFGDKVIEKLPNLDGGYDHLHTIYFKHKELTKTISTIIHEMMHAIVNFIHDEHGSIPEKNEKGKTSWKDISLDSLQRFSEIAPRLETQELLEALDFSHYSISQWQGELISRTTETKFSHPYLEILLNKNSGNFFRAELKKLRERAEAKVQDLYTEAGLGLITAFEKGFFSSFESVKLSGFDIELLNEAFNNKQTVLDCFINKALANISPETLVSHLHQNKNISEYAMLLSAARNNHIEIIKTLFKEFKLDLHHPLATKAFNLAVKNNHIEIVKLFIDHKIDVDLGYEQQLTPLHYATNFGYESLVQLLVKNGANVNAVDRDRNTVLHWAAKHGHIELVKYFTQCSPDLIQQKNRLGETALHLAVQNGHSEIAKYLLLQDNSLATERTSAGDTPLHLASSKGHVDIIQLLLMHKINVNAMNNLGYTPLYSAVKHRQLKSVPLLLEAKGIDTTIACKNTLTSLHLAAASQQHEIVAMLLNVSSKEIMQKICLGETPLHLAAKAGDAASCASLIQFKASPNLKNDKQETPLHLAVLNGSEDVVKLLLDNGASVNAENYYDATPLHFAVANHKNHLLKTLLADKTININATDDGHFSALHFAVLHENITAVEALLKCPNIDINIRNEDGHTPLSLAETKENAQAIVTLLKDFSNKKAINSTRNQSASNKPTFLNTIYSLFPQLKSQVNQGGELKAENKDDIRKIIGMLK